MAYAGNPELSVEAQERVMTAFRQVVTNLQQGQREEAMIGLEFVLRIDPAFTPAVGLQSQLKSGAGEIDLTDIIAQLEAPTTDAINELLVEAVEAFNQRNFIDSKSMVERVLIELPGHQEARALLAQLDEALKIEQQVGQFLAQAREALEQGDAQEASNFVMMAQALDPHHSGIASTLQEIYDKGGLPQHDAAPAEPAPDRGPFDSADEPDAADGIFAGTELEPELSDGPEWDAITSDEAPFEAEPLSEPVEEPQFPPADLDTAAEGEPLTEPVADFFSDEPAVEPDAPVEAGPPADDVSDLFDAGSAPPGAPPSEEEPEVKDLVARGTAAYEAGHFLAAIDAWSRVFLVDPSNAEVPSLIQAAKNDLADSGREVEHLLFDAEDAVIGGDTDKALELVQQVLERNPGHLEALELQQRLTGAAPAPAAAAAAAPAADAMPDLDDDLFSEPFEESEPAAKPEPEDDDLDLDYLPDELKPKRGLSLPRLSGKGWAVVAVGLVIVMVVGWLGLRALTGDGGGAPDAVYTMKDEAEALFKQGDVAAALAVVEGFEPRDEVDEQLVNMLLTKYRAALATPTPTPVPAHAIEARELLAAGLWYRAYDTAVTGLEAHPSDGGLQQIIDEIEASNPSVETLHRQLADGKYRAATATARSLMATSPDQPDVALVLGHSLFNASLAELRAYNLTGASTYLNELQLLDPEDDEVRRVLDFVEKYKARPVDMQLRVFIQSLGERTGWAALEDKATVTEGAAAEPAGDAPPVDPTPTPDAPPA